MWTDNNQVFPKKAKCISWLLERWQKRRGLDTNQSQKIFSSSCECFPSLMPSQNPSLTNMTGQSLVWMTTSRHKIPVQGEKVTYTEREWARVREREREHALWMHSEQALNCSLENGVGICIVKDLRRARRGTLTSSLWAEESHINCSRGWLPSLSMGFRLHFQVKYQVWLRQLNTYLRHCPL